MRDPGFVVVAHLIRTQGRSGELIADIETDFPERFARHERVWLVSPDPAIVPCEAAIERHWLHKGRIVLKFAGINSITDAEAYRGWDVAIPREERTPLTDDSIYIADLIGCHVIDETSSSVDLGPVFDVVRGEGGAADLLVLRNGDEELLVPFARTYLVDFDPNARVLRMRLPAGLTNLNAPMTDEERTAQQHPTEGEEDSDAL